MDLLTDVKVEQKVVERVRLKAETFGQDIQTPDSSAAAAGSSSTHGEPHFKVQPQVLADMYDKLVMPLTKDVQVAYLLRRLG
jgi:chorismate mutase